MLDIKNVSYTGSKEAMNEQGYFIQLQDWLNWWNARRELIFCAFTGCDAPKANLAESIHAGMVHKREVGITLLDSAYLHLKDELSYQQKILDIAAGMSIVVNSSFE